MTKKTHRIFLTEPVLNYRGKAQKSVFLGDAEFRVLKGRAALEGVSARALMTRDLKDARRLLDNKAEEALKRALKYVEGREG